MSTCRKMSKFILDHTHKGRRRGMLTINHTPYPTPAFMVHTSGGSVPHLTPDVFLGKVFPPPIQPPILQMSLDSILTFSDSVVGFGKGLGAFAGLKGCPTFLSVHNPLKAPKSGYNHKKNISLWSRTGRTSLQLADFNKMIGNYGVDLFQTLWDYDVESGKNSLKRATKSTTTSLELLEGTEGEGIFVTIESSWFAIDEELGAKTVEGILKHQKRIHGFVISGLSEEIDYSLIDKILVLLPPEIPRYFPGPLSITQILELVERGIDLFDSSIVTRMADEGQGFYFPEKKSISESLPSKSENQNENENNNSPSPIMCLKDKTYFSDFSPICDSCDCYSCRKHTRAYVNHLFATNELLGPVLLMIHNLTAFNQLFAKIRGAAEDQNIMHSLRTIMTQSI